jgi:hypothetical protein
LLTSCAVRIIAPYDQVTDEKISNLQEEVVIKMTKWEREIPDIKEEYPFYDRTESVLEILIFRNQEIEKSEIIVLSLQKLLDNIKIIKGAHEKNMLNIEVIKQIKPDIMAQFNAIQTFQSALKRAQKINKL